MKALRIVLVVVGLLILVFSLPGVFVSWEKLGWLAQKGGLAWPEASESGIMVYAVRASFMTFVWAGVLFLLAAVDPVKYVGLVRALAVALVCIGITCVLVGVKRGLPFWVYLIDGGIGLVGGGLIWTLSCPTGKAGKTCCGGGSAKGQEDAPETSDSAG